MSARRPPNRGSGAVPALVLGLLLAAGLAGLGYFLADALQSIRGAERTVQVKGLAEREVPADLALWSVSFVTTGDTLDALHKQLEKDAASVMKYLADQGFADEEVVRAAPEITDRQAQNYNSSVRGPRYQAQSVMLVRTPKVDAVRAAQQNADELVGRGVTLNRNYEYPTEYLFTALNDIKPEMIAQATRSAREAAEQFASDSGSAVGAIKQARQGYFSIEDRDRLSPHIKRIRVVTTVDYFLVD